MPGQRAPGRSRRRHSWLIPAAELVEDRGQLRRLDRLSGRGKFFAGKPAVTEQRSGLAVGQALATGKVGGSHPTEKEHFWTLEMVSIPAEIALHDDSRLSHDVRCQSGLLVQLPARGGDMRLPRLQSAARRLPEDCAVARVPPAKQQDPALRVYAQH